MPRSLLCAGYRSVNKELEPDFMMLGSSKEGTKTREINMQISFSKLRKCPEELRHQRGREQRSREGGG